MGKLYTYINVLRPKYEVLIPTIISQCPVMMLKTIYLHQCPVMMLKI
jgi:hypothetical protein